MGRPAGALNKSKVGLKARLKNDFNLDVIEEMATIVMERHTAGEHEGEFTHEQTTRFKMLQGLAEYVESKRKAIEVTGEDGGPLQVSVQKYVGMLDAD